MDGEWDEMHNINYLEIHKIWIENLLSILPCNIMIIINEIVEKVNYNMIKVWTLKKKSRRFKI